MNTETKLPTEQEMRNMKVPCPNTREELSNYIEGLTNRKHDYGTCVYAMSMAATAAFNHVASKLGVNGFQASCADLDILRRTRNMEGPFILLKGYDMLYPHYDLQKKLKEAMDEWQEWAAEEAQKMLDIIDPKYPPCLEVKEHWEKLAAYKKSAEENVG